VQDQIAHVDAIDHHGTRFSIRSDHLPVLLACLFETLS
jgi:hypothetical protein